MKNRFEQTIIKSQLEIQNQTLNYIGSEIHDDTAQVVYLSMLRIAYLKEKIDEKEKEEITTFFESNILSPHDYLREPVINGGIRRK